MNINPKVFDIYHLNANDAHGGDGADFAKAYAAGFRGVIHKASQGTHMVDKLYRVRRPKALDAGLLWGAYHFNSGENAAAQAQHFLDCTTPVEGTLMALDLEDNPPRAGGRMNLAQAREFLDRVDQATGRSTVLYSGNLIKELIAHANDADYTFFATHPLWMPQYAPTPNLRDYNGHPLPWAKVFLWQYTGDGIGQKPHDVPGIGRNMDINHYDGTDDELRQEWTA